MIKIYKETKAWIHTLNYNFFADSNYAFPEMETVLTVTFKSHCKKKPLKEKQISLLAFRQIGLLTWLTGHKEKEEKRGHLTERCCSPSTVFFTEKGQRIEYGGTPAEGNH